MAGGGRAWAVSVECSSIRQKDIHPAVIVEIENHHPVAGGLEDVFLPGLATRDICGRQAGFDGEISEIHGDGWQVRLDARSRTRLTRRTGHPLEDCDHWSTEEQ